MKRILFISHRIPFPPNKGDKIRSYSIIKSLKKLGHSIDLAFLVDDPDDIKYIPQLERTFGHIYYGLLNKFDARLLAALSYFTFIPASILYFYHKGLKQKIEDASENNQYDVIFYFSGASLNYFMPSSRERNIIDFVDID